MRSGAALPPPPTTSPAGIAYVDDEGTIIDLADAEARDLLDTNAEVRHQWTKWTSMTGQANLPPEKRRGRLLILARHP